MAEEKKSFRIFPVGTVRKQGDEISIEIDEEYADALRGLEGFSHLILLSWFHESDDPGKRATLQVHPRGNPENPLTGVFATRSPVRPNPVAVSVCRILAVQGRTIRIDHTDAIDGTPVIDIKPYIPISDAHGEAVVPDWVKK